jgi:hypothetical protein
MSPRQVLVSPSGTVSVPRRRHHFAADSLHGWPVAIIMGRTLFHFAPHAVLVEQLVRTLFLVFPTEQSKRTPPHDAITDAGFDLHADRTDSTTTQRPATTRGALFVVA